MLQLIFFLASDARFGTDMFLNIAARFRVMVEWLIKIAFLSNPVIEH